MVSAEETTSRAWLNVEPNQRLEQLKGMVEAAMPQVQGQLNNLQRVALPVPLAALVAAIGLPLLFHILLLWIPASFILWGIYLIWSILQNVWSSLTINRDVVVRQYGRLARRRKSLGRETWARRLTPPSRAIAAIYAVSAVVLLLPNTAFLGPTKDYSVWLPLVAVLALILFLLGSPIAASHLSISGLDRLLTIYRNGRRKLIPKVTPRCLLLAAVTLLGVVALTALYVVVVLVLPWRALSVTLILYHAAGANVYEMLLVLLLQVLFFFLLSWVLTEQAARTEMTNSVASFENITLRTKQIEGIGHVADSDVKVLERQFYVAVKYRFVREQILGFIPVYVPVLNEAYVKWDTAHRRPR